MLQEPLVVHRRNNITDLPHLMPDIMRLMEWFAKASLYTILTLTILPNNKMPYRVSGVRHQPANDCRRRSFLIYILFVRSILLKNSTTTRSGCAKCSHKVDLATVSAESFSIITRLSSSASARMIQKKAKGYACHPFLPYGIYIFLIPYYTAHSSGSISMEAIKASECFAFSWPVDI